MTKPEEFLKAYREIEARAMIYASFFHPNYTIEGIELYGNTLLIKLVEYSRCSCCPDETQEFEFDWDSLDMTEEEYRNKLRSEFREKERFKREEEEKKNRIMKLEKEQAERDQLAKLQKKYGNQA